MNRTELFDKLKTIKTKYEPEGFIILGVFGSYARGEETADSDIDLLYRCDEPLTVNYRGWEFFGFYEKVKNELETELGKKVDLADVDSLNRVGKKYILPELVYVA